MSETALPISPAAFAAALRDLPITTLHLKAAELRNSIAHLDYSNEQLKPFAYPPGIPHNQGQTISNGAGATTADGPTGTINAQGDQDCIDAILENEVVIQRMEDRIRMLRAEVERRGASWTEFLSPEEVAAKAGETATQPLTNGTTSASSGIPDRSTARETSGSTSNPWTDGTFQTGVISGGEVIMNEHMEGIRDGISSQPTNRNGTGGTIGDEELRRRMEERMREAMGDDDDEDGMHL